jgi:chemotaxis protein MotB
VALRDQLLRAIADVNLLNKLKKQIEITLTEEGLRIELIEDEKGTFFELGSAEPTQALREILKVLAEELKNVPNRISIEGHTDAQRYAMNTVYGNWELSTDRANVARREMERDGIRLDQVSQVRGFADQRLHIPLKPFDPANRRVSLVVQNLSHPATLKEGSNQLLAGSNDSKPQDPKAGSGAKVLAQGTGEPHRGLWDHAKALLGR